MGSPAESKDGTGAGDCDREYRWGSPRSGLTLWQQAHLLVMRGYARDHYGAIVGDSDWVEPTPSGLWLAPYWRD